jgi:hypothetical protein
MPDGRIALLIAVGLLVPAAVAAFLWSTGSWWPATTGASAEAGATTDAGVPVDRAPGASLTGSVAPSRGQFEVHNDYRTGRPIFFMRVRAYVSNYAVSAALT